MRRSIQLVLGLLLIFSVSVSTANATVLGGLLKGGYNTLNDNSRTQIVDMNQNNVLDVGDVIYGVFEIEKMNGSGDPSPGAIYAIYSAQLNRFQTVAAGTLGHAVPTPVGTLEPVTNRDVSVRGLLDDPLEPAAYAGSWNDVMYALLEINQVTLAKNPFDPQYSQAADIPPHTAVIDATLTQANGYRLDALAGMAGGTSDFTQALILGSYALVDLPPVGDSDGTTELNELRSALTNYQGTQIFMQRGGYSILYEDVPELLSWNQVSIWDYLGAQTQHDLVLLPDAAVQIAQDVDIPNWDLADDSNLAMDVEIIPEPMTMLLLGAGAVGVVLRRKR